MNLLTGASLLTLAKSIYSWISTVFWNRKIPLALKVLQVFPGEMIARYRKSAAVNYFTCNRKSPWESVQCVTAPNKAFTCVIYKCSFCFQTLNSGYTCKSFIKLTFGGCCLKVTRPSFFRGYHPTLKLSGIPAFTFIVSLTHRIDKI